MQSVDNMFKTLKQHDTHYSLESAFYQQAQWFEAEIEYIWKQSWIFVGHPADIPNPLDYICFRIGDIFLVLFRTPDETFSAAFNEDENGMPMLMQHKGNLADVGLSAHDFDNKLIHTNECIGYIFVCVDRRA